ncbi:phosphoesterase [Thalassobaculum fulvum]|uniref:Phosphoesterase n=1 Tax=Thalassobaculum fulvum TaxID=1633335 RepID=A0A919CSA7_9PROT|nr:metallophosphoesterase family protein [Thalassobaculum fulvum]GHD62646.1 phosphoesterase [Thalassobaculum fulvum]
MLTIGVVSDTHGLLRPEAAARLAGVAHIVHAGDIGRPEVIAELERIAPVTAIRGNVDTGAWATAWPETRTVTLGGRRLHLLHDLNALALDPAAEGIDAVISGHSHKPRVETVGGVLYLNPGSAGPRRFRLPVTLATLEIAGDGLRATLHHLLVDPA